MADIFSNSLDVSSLINDRPEPKPAVDPLATFADEIKKEEFVKTQAAARWARQHDPQAYARASQLAPGLDPERGVRQLQLLEDSASLAQYKAVFEKSPALRGYFAKQPKDLAYAKPDELDNISGLLWLHVAGAEAVKAGYTTFQAAMASNRVAAGTGTIQDKAFVNNYSNNRNFGARGFLEEGFVGAAQQVVPLALTAAHAIKGAVVGGAGGGAVGAAAGSVVPGPGTVAGGIAGTITGMKVGGTLGAFTFQQAFQTGMSRLHFQTFRDENGNPLEPELIEFAAQATGLGGALLEQVALSQAIKTIPGGDRIVGLVTREGMATALKNPTIRTALLNFAKGLGTTVATEITTEVLQQGLQIAAGEIAKANSEGQFEYMTGEEIVGELGTAAYQAAQVMALMGPFLSGTRFGADIMTITRSQREHKSLTNALEQLAGNQLVERAPELSVKLIDQQLEGKKVYVPAQEMLELYQEQGLDVYGPPLPNWRSRFDEALATNGDVEISVGEFATYLGRDPKENALLSLVRTDPNGFTAAEIEPFIQAQEELMSSDIARATRVSSTAPAGRAQPQPLEVFPELEEIKKQIKAVGFAPQAVDHYATMLSAFYQTMAGRTGVSPSEFFQEFNLSLSADAFSNVNGISPNPEEFFQGVSPEQAQETLTEMLGPIGDLAPTETQPLASIEVPSLEQGTKGSITFEGNAARIRLFEGNDMSTLLHESGHFFLNTLRAVAERSPELSSDWNIVKNKLKIGEDNKITREQHEQFARMAEAYFMEGKSPAPELQSMFTQFRSWLKTLYQSIKKLGGRVSPEISAVFDRMLVAEERFAELAEDRAYAPLFDSAEAMGIDPAAYIEYQKLVEDLRNEAQESLRERVAGRVEKRSKGWMGEIEKQVRREAEANLKKMPPYSHKEILEGGKVAIDVEAFTAKYGADAAKKFPRKAMKKAGLAPEVVAELLGYPTADDMVYDFVQAAPIKDAAKEAAALEMGKRYGDDFSDSAVLDAVIKQELAQDARMLVLGKEYQALSTKAGKIVSELSPAQLAQRIARDSIYGKKVGDVKSYQTQAAVRRAATMAEAAMVKGDWAKAADHKRKQMLAQAIDNETQKMEQRLTQIRNKGARYTRTTSKTIDPSFMEQIRAIVDQYDFAKISGKKLAKRQSLREFLEEQEADGLVALQIPERLLRDSGKINYKELTVEDLLDIGDTLENLEHLGRTKHKLRTAKGLREWAEVKGEVMNQLNSLPKRERKAKTYTQEETKLRDILAGFHSSMLKPEQIIDWLDAGNIAGPMMEHVFQPIADAQYAQDALNLEYNKKLVDIFQDIDSNYLSEVVNVPGMGTKMTRQEIYAMALNTGTESNKRKLLEGELISDIQLEEALAHMTADDWAKVQKIWKLLDSLWPKIAALEKKLTGVAPPRIEPREFTNQHGTFSGGYYPVVYDFKVRRGRNLIEDTTPKDKVLADGLFQMTNIRPGTNHKHTVKRTKTAKPIRLELSVLPGHIHNVIHDLTYREPVRAAYKVLWDPDIRKAIEDAEGGATYEQLQHWLRAVASEHALETDSATRFIQRVRTGATMYGMGYRVTTALAQPLGFFNSMIKVEKRFLLNGLYQMTRHPYQTMELVNGLSSELRNRFNTQDRDIRDTVKKVSLKDTKLDKVRKFAFYMIGAADKYVASATWLGAYQEFLSKNPKSETLAIRHADRTVRLTQGTGTVKDMAKITNSSELMKLFTMFYSAFSAQYNMQVDLTRKTKGDIAENNWGTVLTERLPQWAYLIVFPAIFGALVGGQGPEEDENVAWWATKKVVTYPAIGVVFVRDIIGAVESGFDYKMSPAAKFMSSSVRGLEALFEAIRSPFDDEAEVDLRSIVKPATEAGSIYFKLPAGAAVNTVDGLWQGLEKGDFQAKDLIYGRQGR